MGEYLCIAVLMPLWLLSIPVLERLTFYLYMFEGQKMAHRESLFLCCSNMDKNAIRWIRYTVCRVLCAWALITQMRWMIPYPHREKKGQKKKTHFSAGISSKWVHHQIVHWPLNAMQQCIVVQIHYSFCMKYKLKWLTLKSGVSLFFFLSDKGFQLLLWQRGCAFKVCCVMWKMHEITLWVTLSHLGFP